MRPPLALERLTESSHGQLVFALPHPRTDGATHLLLDPLELIEKLTLLIPPPRFHTLRFHGVLAPAAAGRSAVIPGRPEAEEEGPTAGPGEGPGPPAAPRERASLWAALRRRVFAIAVFQCPRCGAGGGSRGCTPGASGGGSCSSGWGSGARRARRSRRGRRRARRSNRTGPAVCRRL